MKNKFPIKKLSKQQIQVVASTNPGIYKWWFDEEGSRILLVKLSMSVLDEKIQKKEFDGETYYALYFGISKNIRDRILWHIYDKHTESAVKSGFISTLRQSICALLDIDFTKGEEDVNEFINKHCYLEWEENEYPELVEKNELSNNCYYYPLNIQDNKSLPKEKINILKNLREIHKR